MLTINGKKKCSKCEKPKEIDEFYADKSKPDGHRPNCKMCLKAYQDKPEIKARRSTCGKKKYADNADKILLKQAEYYAAHPDKLRLNRAQHYSLNKEEIGKKHAIYARENRDKRNALTAKRHAKKIKATPPWANKDIIRLFYEQAKFKTEQEGIPYEVDHVFPLNGKTVSGLHCEQNLRVITAAENLAKGVRFES